MLELVFMPKAWEDLGWWIKNDIKAVKKIYSVLENTCNTPFEGLGQPKAQSKNYLLIKQQKLNF